MEVNKDWFKKDVEKKFFLYCNSPQLKAYSVKTVLNKVEIQDVSSIFVEN